MRAEFIVIEISLKVEAYAGGGDRVSGILRPAGSGKQVPQGGCRNGFFPYGVRFLGRHGNTFSAVAGGLRLLGALGRGAWFP